MIVRWTLCIIIVQLNWMIMMRCSILVIPGFLLNLEKEKTRYHIDAVLSDSSTHYTKGLYEQKMSWKNQMPMPIISMKMESHK